MLQTAGWSNATDEARHALLGACRRMKEAGIEIVDRSTDKTVALVKSTILHAYALTMDINAWEGRWPLNTYAHDMERSNLSRNALDRLAAGNAMTLDTYRTLVAERQRVREVLLYTQGPL